MADEREQALINDANADDVDDEDDNEQEEQEGNTQQSPSTSAWNSENTADEQDDEEEHDEEHDGDDDQDDDQDDELDIDQLVALATKNLARTLQTVVNNPGLATYVTDAHRCTQPLYSHRSPLVPCVSPPTSNRSTRHP
jgi:hypothetical protein